MGQTQTIGRHATTVATGNGVTRVTYHSTVVVAWDRSAGKITLRSGGWETNTTKSRMNQASNQLGLGFMVWQRDFAWHVDLPSGETVDFYDGITFDA